MQRLRRASVARQLEWDPDRKITLAYRGCELGGEAGEACNVLKKLERERLGLVGSHSSVLQAADELADVVICADLIAASVGLNIVKVDMMSDSSSDLVTLGNRLMWRAGMVCLSVDRVDGRYGLAGSGMTEAIAGLLDAVTRCCHKIGIDIDAVVPAKFNATSVKYGLRTRME